MEKLCDKFNKVQVNDSWYNESTIYLVNEWMGAKGIVLQMWMHGRAL